MRIIPIANRKGGVGKTSITVNLAQGLTIIGHKVLVIDLDDQAQTTSHLGLKNCRYDVSDFIMGMEFPKIVKHYQGMDVLPGSAHTSTRSVELFKMKERNLLLSNALHSAKLSYDFIIIDTPPGLSLMSINAYAAATDVFVVVDPEFLPLEGLDKLNNTLQKVRDRHGRFQKITGIVINKYRKRLKINQKVIDAIRSKYDYVLFRTFVHENVKIKEAPYHGLDIFSYDPSSQGAQDFFHLSKEVNSKVN